MNNLLGAFLLLSVPLLPIVLAFPPLRSRISHPCHIALLPAIILLAVPPVGSIELPWLLFGSGFGIDGASRWLLAMSVVIWTAAATLLQPIDSQAADNRRTVFFLLAMAGNLGLIVATDVVGFFSFSALMGYGFYGLLVAGGDETARRTGRIYLGFMIVADLLLFEALLIVAATTSDMGFEAVRHTIAQSHASGLYVSLVFAGFALKTGIWPLHSWLPLAFRSAPPAVALLVGGVPIAMGLLGMVRWLPLGEITLPGLGLIIQLLGVAAILYAIVAGAKRVQMKLLPAYAAIIATGSFSIALGAVLADSSAWNHYGKLSYLFIVSLGFGIVVVVVAICWLQTNRHTPAVLAKQADDSSLWFERWAGAAVCWSGEMGFDTLPRLQASWLVLAGRLLQTHAWQRTFDASERSLQCWILAITLFLLLGIVMAFVGASSWV